MPARKRRRSPLPRVAALLTREMRKGFGAVVKELAKVAQRLEGVELEVAALRARRDSRRSPPKA